MSNTTITTHHDGHGLNESLAIYKDEPGPGGASHYYSVQIVGEGINPRDVAAFVQFQKGPRNEPDSIPGVTELALLAIVRDRLESFNAGEFRCRQNAISITKIEEAMHWLKDRADERARRGVLGSYRK
jgi:hypothetical protein